MKEEEKKKPEDLSRATLDLELETKEEEVEVKVSKKNEEDFASLPHIEKIRMAAGSKGVEITSANPSCKKCYGRGYISTTRNVVKIEGEDDIIQKLNDGVIFFGDFFNGKRFVFHLFQALFHKEGFGFIGQYLGKGITPFQHPLYVVFLSP